MRFDEKYTTADFVSNESVLVLDPMDIGKDYISEVQKIVISNDAFAIGEMMQELSDRLELLNNRMVK